MQRESVNEAKVTSFSLCLSLFVFFIISSQFSKASRSTCGESIPAIHHNGPERFDGLSRNDTGENVIKNPAY